MALLNIACIVGGCMDHAEGKHCKCITSWNAPTIYPPLEQSPHTPTLLPPTPPKALVCEIWKRHVVVQFVQYTSQVGSRYAAPQWLKNDWESARWLWWTSPLPALSFFSVWLPRLPCGQRAGNLSYWSEAVHRFPPTPSQLMNRSLEFTYPPLMLPKPSMTARRPSFGLLVRSMLNKAVLVWPVCLSSFGPG